MPAATHSLLGAAERSCATCLHEIDVASLPRARETLALCRGILRVARGGASRPPSLQDIDAAVMACRQRRVSLPADETNKLRVVGRTWATALTDVLWYLFRWLRALGRELRGEDVYARAAFHSCTRVCKTWRLIATEELWRIVDVIPARNLMGHFDATVSRGTRSCLMGRAPRGSYVRAIRCGYDASEDPAFLILLPIAWNLLPDLHDGPDYWKADPAGKAILQSARRLRSLDLATGGDEHVSTNSPNLSVLCSTPGMRSAHIAAIAAGSHHLLSLNLSYGHITDDAVQTLLRYCPSIVELCLFDTEITVATIQERDVYLFDTEDTEISLGELLFARACDDVPGHGPKSPSLSYLRRERRLAQRLQALRNLCIDNSVEWEKLGTSLSSLVELHGTDDFDHLLAVDMCWDELTGTTPP
ncbi:hypothetical protein BDK51DRAFT_42480 [Blyttiomyces helicus]|uniref:F-box domain-containing protein n=1 Tax=Blyttiomyces helicus TaxID=388810 RepID=A0A4P9WMM0_9FUNG|nr:hypothetical protein BDK51DRAFT_42480 [Blyttiomyces helicus]|eukprot:RKO93273.1 hypothetical protein BDK51DRAFT_42480 [Blyttiomyces helicus]